jgi:hypothetical protein
VVERPLPAVRTDEVGQDLTTIRYEEPRARLRDDPPVR